MKHDPIPMPSPVAGTLALILANLTDDQIAAYLKARAPFLRLAEVKDHPHVRSEAAAYAFAGVNRMAHHDRPCRGGMAGGLDVLTGMMSPERAKFKAGDWLRAARLNLAWGDRKAVAECLDRAAAMRRRAATLTDGKTA